MKKILVKYALLFLLLGSVQQLFSQQNQTLMNQIAGRLDAYTDSLPRASIYINTSKDIYEAGEDVWFKAFLLDAQDYSLFGMDKTLYVRIVKTGRDSVVWEEKYAVKSGVASGHIFLDNSLPEGNYYLTAYSAHSFYSNTSYFQVIKIIKVIREIRSLLKEKPPVITSDSGTHQNIQFSILPEGGQIISGIANKVAFKAVDQSGLPVDVSGELLQGNMPVKTLKSTHDGMGSFYFRPVPGVNYQIRLTSPKTGKLYPLPPVQEKGVVLHLLKSEKDTLVFNIFQSPGSAKQPIFLRLQVGGRVQSMAVGVLGDSLKVKLPVVDAMQGIAEATVFDQQMRPLAERLVYINEDKGLNITTNLPKEIYKTREKVTVKIKTIDENGKPVPANVGITVHDKLYHNAEDAKDILTHYYLSIELKGKIIQPGLLF